MQRVPRYTSYPTAPHFHEGVQGKELSSWLDKLDNDGSLSLYFHILYCTKLCWFCGCHKRIVNNYEPIARYLELLEKEVALVAPHVERTPVSHVHFGGGSPTILSAVDFIRFMDLIKQRFNFAADAEIAVEMDPRTMDADKIAAYAETGVNRASLGVQDFNHKVQEAVNRVQPYEMVHDVVTGLRDVGINALNVDLIYGLPYQTVKTIEDTVERTVTLKPDRISLFGYAHVPWMAKHQKLMPEDALPDKEARIEMFDLATEMFLAAGYVSIGLDHFALPDDELAIAAQNKTLQRNFQGYTTDTSEMLIGMGVSAISSLPSGYAQNTPSNVKYAQMLEAGDIPTIRGLAITAEDIERRRIIMSLMCNMQVEISADKYSKELDKLKDYMITGDVCYNDGLLIIDEKARNRLRLIASAFDTYLEESEHRYSQAV